ncbi:MAG: efflux RND transporter periplasmic adaptor subunit [Myxococcota bacterium]
MNQSIRYAAPLVVMLFGAGLAVLFILSRSSPERVVPEPLPTRVDVALVTTEERPVEVQGTGEVVSARQVELLPEVTGRVRAHHAQLRPGGTVESGALLLTLDSRDYQAALAQAEASLEQARFELTLEKGRQRIAQKEFELLRTDENMSPEEKGLALREPHLRKAEASVRAAESAHDKAKLDVARTRIRAPFDAFVQTESVDLGQLVGPQSVLARLVGTEVFWVQIKVPVSSLSWLRRGTPATLRQTSTGQILERRGEVIEVLSDLDQVGRMARVLVAIEDPLHLDRPEADRQPLLLGAFVEASLEGRAVQDVAVIPRPALRGEDEVWLMDAEDRLEIRDVEIVWRGRDEVYVQRGLKAGERLVTSRIATPVPGMALRTSDSEPGTPAAAL